MSLTLVRMDGVPPSECVWLLHGTIITKGGRLDVWISIIAPRVFTDDSWITIMVLLSLALFAIGMGSCSAGMMELRGFLRSLELYWIPFEDELCKLKICIV